MTLDVEGHLPLADTMKKSIWDTDGQKARSHPFDSE